MSPAPTHPISFPKELPLSERVQDIARAIHDNPVVIVAGETGSGKTTQLPKICLALGRGLRAHIGCTQPRRLAATSVAARVAQELGVELGREVGYKIRFSDRTSPETYVKFVTDGLLLAELQSDPQLRHYDTLIIDEAHERNLNIDFLLGYLKRLVPKRPDLRVVLSSATLDTDRFSEFFDRAPIVQVSGRSHPVEVVYHPGDENLELADRVLDALEEITLLDPRSDVLVFLPGEREIQEASEVLTAKAFPHTVLLPLYSRLPPQDQLRVFQTLPQRRIVLATNVAETSLTIPGIVFVVDSGLARINRYNPRNGLTQLLVEPISRANAEQRKGRAGRLRSGVCYRLYSEQDFEERAPYAPPEIQRVGLAGVILQMKVLGLGKIESFPFLDPPSKRAIDDGYRVLEELGAVDDNGEPNDRGRTLARFPLDPRLARMIVAADQEGCLREVLVLAAALSIQDPRERPLAAQKQADQAHRQFRDETSDFLGLLKLWDNYQDARARLSRKQLHKHCRERFVSSLRMKDWSDIHTQLLERCRELQYRPKDQPAKGDAIHRALLSGLLGRIGQWHPDKRAYFGPRQLRFLLHPSSSLANKPPAWVFSAEIVETTQPFARLAAALDPTWVEQVAGALCKRTYQDPHWEERPAQVVAKEQVTLFGLPIVCGRRVHYGPIAPAVARSLFLLHALVRQEYSSKAQFIEHNRKVLEQAKHLRDKARRSDLLYDEDALLPFFESKVPQGVFNGKTFEAWRRTAEAENPSILKLSLADVLLAETSDLAPSLYPDSLPFNGTSLALSYRFEPGEEDDGITVAVPLALLPQIDPDVFEWTIPAWHAEKILLALQSLPKALRRDIAPLGAVAIEISEARKPFESPFLSALASDVHSLTGVRVPRDAWRLDELPQHLRFFFRILDADGKTLGQGRDLGPLKRRFEAASQELWSQSVNRTWERDGLKSWSFDSLPERVALQVGGVSTFAYPALVDQVTSVSLRLVSSQAGAEQATQQGLRRLFLLQLGETDDHLESLIPPSLALAAIGPYVAGRSASLRSQIVRRALDDTFGLTKRTGYPRSRKAFLERFERGRALLQGRVHQLRALAEEIGAALSKVETQLRNLPGKPGAARPALDDVRAQIAALLPTGLFEHEGLERLSHFTRYLRAIQVRLERLPNDPRRDADKAAQVVPLWNSFVDRRDTLRSKGVSEEEIDSFRWLLEELRVCLFAPELKTAVPVSPSKVAERWKTLEGR